MKTHKLKTLQPHFDEVAAGRKRAEIRLNDRNFAVGDIIELSEFNGAFETGKTVRRQITHVLDDPSFLREGFVMLSMCRVRNPKRSTDHVRGSYHDDAKQHITESC